MSEYFCKPFVTDQWAEFVALANQGWDLILVDSLFTPCGYTMAAWTGKPYVILHTGILEHNTPDNRGLPLLTHTYPKLFGQIKFSADEFWDRLDNFFDYLKFKLLTFCIDKAVSGAAKPLVPDFNLPEFLKNADMAYVDHPSTFDWPKPLGLDIITTGAIIHELRHQFLNKRVNGLVSV